MRACMLWLVVSVLGFAPNLPGTLAQGAADRPIEITVEGVVAEVFGNRFIVETDRGRILVDPAGILAPLKVSPGDRVSAVGGMTERTLEARRISGSDGSVLYDYAQPGARPHAEGRLDIKAALAKLQLTPIGQPVRKKHHTEIMARMGDARTVFVSFDRFGRIGAIEDAVHDKATVVAARPLSRDDYLDVARRAGFEPLDDLQTKKHHVELLGRNRAGDLIELHIDRAGYIYKQVWVR
jgi:hypothetical protein